MKKSLILAACLVGCGSPASEKSTTAGFLFFEYKEGCSTEKPLEGAPGALWRSTSEDNIPQDQVGKQFGVETTFETRADSWLNPLGGSGVLRRAVCTRAFVKQDENAPKVYLEADRQPGSYYVNAVVADKAYLLMTGQNGYNNRNLKMEAAYLNFTTGKRTMLASEAVAKGGCGPSFGVYPSPQGEHFVVVRLQSVLCDSSEMSRDNLTATVYDASAKLVGSPIKANVTAGSQIVWTSETEFSIRDNERELPQTVPGF